jgi:uncharacterized protein YbjT (DUF2867 family)
VASDVAVAGATGMLGRRICAALRGHGASVRALGRPGRRLDEAQEDALAGAERVAADLTERDSLPPAVEAAACVVSTATCFPHPGCEALLDAVDRDGNIALAEAAAAAGVPRFVFVSFKPVPLDFPLQRAKRAVERRLAQLELDAIVLRPGKFMDIWFSPLCGFDVAARRATIFGEGAAPVSWIAAADVAEIAARAALGAPPRDALGARPRDATIELGGPEPLSQRDAVRIYEDVTGDEWSLHVLPEPELRRRLAGPADDFDESLAALMLEAHLGSVVPSDAWRNEFPLRPTSVREFAVAAAG